MRAFIFGSLFLSEDDAGRILPKYLQLRFELATLEYGYRRLGLRDYVLVTESVETWDWVI